ncbi:MAG: hypothetical protein HZB80_07845 [Deltaproteobacteria bacterium]|nr:hypothetical protein [Deltaproteobacteria bacterium]
MSFKNRWRIEGMLTTISPLHIGSGDTTTRDKILDEKKKKKADIAAVATDHENKPYLPGSTLKGNLRAYLRNNGQDKNVIDKLFGAEDPKAKDSCGGALEFWNVRVVDMSSTFDGKNVPYWCKDRLTGVTASAVIDRQTRTAANQKLFYTEYVPKGIEFNVVITGQDLDDKEIALLIHALNGFKDGGVNLGAGEADNWGGFSWELETVKCIETDDIKKWLANPDTVGYEMISNIGRDKKTDVEYIEKQLKQSKPDILSLAFTLTFDSSFLVNDTSRDRDAKDGTGKKKFADHYPLTDTSGKVILPSKSIRGAFRSQAERILRTIGGGQAACIDHEKAERKACPSVYEVEKVKDSCPACQVFGLSGWRSPVQFSDFTYVKNGGIKRQQFVAIDRFTGGGVDRAKFDADYADRPVLEGTIAIDMTRLRKTKAIGWGLGLVALTLRDMIEGDVTLGLGTSKGY